MFQHLVHEWTPEKMDTREVAVKVSTFASRRAVLEAGAPKHESYLRSDDCIISQKILQNASETALMLWCSSTISASYPTNEVIGEAILPFLYYQST
jgi:hypothetical protein